MIGVRRASSSRAPLSSLRTSALLLLGLSIWGCAAPALSTYSTAEELSSQDDVGAWRRDERLSRPVDPEAFDEAAARAAIFYASNARRAEHALPALKRSATLERAAQLHAERMHELDFIAHEDPHSARYKTPTDRARAAGALNPMTSENVATHPTIHYESGQPVYIKEGDGPGVFRATPQGEPLETHTYVTLAETLVERWMDSPGHRRNLLDPEAVELGCGAHFAWVNQFPSIYAVQNFQRFEPLKSEA